MFSGVLEHTAEDGAFRVRIDGHGAQHVIGAARFEHFRLVCFSFFSRGTVFQGVDVLFGERALVMTAGDGYFVFRHGGVSNDGWLLTAIPNPVSRKKRRLVILRRAAQKVQRIIRKN